MLKLFARLTGCFVMALSVVSHGAEVLVFDSFTGADSYTTTSGSPRTYMGYAFNAADPGGGSPTLAISKVTVYLAHTGAAAATFNQLRIQIQFWDTWASGAVPAVFSNAPGPVQFADIAGPITLSPNTYSPIDITFATPVILNGLSNHGYAVNFLADSGAGLVSSDALTSLLRIGVAPVAVGTSPLPNNTYGYRNVSGQTNFNFASTDLRGFGAGANQAMVFKVFAQTPPTVTVNQAVGQADPVNVSPVNFTVAFSEPVTGFAADDVSFAGSSVAGTLQATVSGGPSVYNVAVSGMQGSGNIVVSVGATAALNAANLPNTASTSTDNTVAFTSCNLDFDRNGTVDATTDGLLVTRFLRGMTGAGLVANALAPNATVTNPQVIGELIISMLANASMDIDGDGNITAESDGVLLLRALANNTNLSGIPALGTPTRTTWPAIRSYLNTICLLNLP